jgi:hypothetical protein
MAQTVVISGSHNTAKIRNPWGVIGLTIITLGIYHFFWWYYINRELRDYGIVKQRDLGKSPTLSLLAIWLGAFTLYIATVWTIVTTSQRIRRAQAIAGVENFDPVVAWLLWIFTLGIGGWIYTQYQLNKVWEAPGQVTTLMPGAIGTMPVANADLDRLKQLSELKESGSLTDDEFEAEKARLGLRSETDTSPPPAPLKPPAPPQPPAS